MWPSGRFGGGSKALAPTKPPSLPLSSSPSCANTRTKSTSSILDNSSTSTSTTSTSSRSSSASLSSSSSSSSASSSSSSSSRGLLQSAFPFLPGFFSSFSGGGAGARDTFKPMKEHTSGKRISLHRYSQATLATGITRAAVACPASEDPDEWLAVHTVDAYNEVALLYGVIHGKCLASNESCAVMNAGAEYEYLWADNNLHKRPTKVSAKEYVGLLLEWVEEQLNDPSVFPPSTDVAFPKNFKATVGKIFTRMFRVYAHIYLTHVPDMERAGAISHLNSCFRKFIFCALEFTLIQEREQAPLQILIRSILIEDARRHAAEHKSSRSPSSLRALGRPSLAAASATLSPHQARLQRLGSNSVNASSSSSSSSSSLRPGKGAASSPAPPSPTPPPRKERASFPSSFFSLSSSSSSSSSAASPSSSTPSKASRPQHRVPRSNSTSSGDAPGNGSGSNKLKNMMMQGLQPRDARARPQKVAGQSVRL